MLTVKWDVVGGVQLSQSTQDVVELEAELLRLLHQVAANSVCFIALLRHGHDILPVQRNNRISHIFHIWTHSNILRVKFSNIMCHIFHLGR